MSAKVIMYTKSYCPYCVNAKALLKTKNVVAEEISIDTDEQARDKMIEITGRRTVPQIIINGQSVGGFDDIKKLNDEGKLDTLLGL